MARVLNHQAVRSTRDLVGISGRELGRRCGLSHDAISAIELGKYKVSPPTQRRIADALGVPLDAITYVVPEPEAVSS